MGHVPSPAPRQPLRPRPATPVALLVAVTAVWGSTFVIVKAALARMAVMDFLAWRFVLATLVMVAIRPRAILSLSRRGWWQGGLLGLALGGGYVTQTFGLEHTSAAVSGFVTGMFVVFTPLISGLLLRRRISTPARAATLVAATGLAIIALAGGGGSGTSGGGLGGSGLGLGVWLTLGCAFFYAVQIVGLGEWSSEHDPFALAIVQLLTAAVCCVLAAAPSTLRPPPDAGVWAAVAVTAVLATAVAFLIQTWAQALMPPTRAAIVMTMEPVFAGISAAVAGEQLGWGVLAGGALVLAAMYLVELAPRRAAP